MALVFINIDLMKLLLLNILDNQFVCPVQVSHDNLRTKQFHYYSVAFQISNYFY